MDDQTLHHFMQDLLPMVVLPVMTIAAAWIISLIIAAFRHRATLRAQAEFHNRLLDKFGSNAEFADYLKSEAGQNFFENIGNEPATPMTRILSSVQRGVILTLLGLGFFLTRFVIGTADSYSVMIIVATILMMVGVGFLVSSAISYRLAKSWGLISTAASKPTAAQSSTNTI